jgi:hypothetical protein
MAQTVINIKDLSSDGVTLTPSTSPNFNTRVTALIGTPSGLVAALMPYSVILTNSTTRTIRGYALRWKGFDKQGNPTYSNLQIEQNFGNSSGTG